jgi:GH35 family endo-1,4-beta-xylanase
MNKLISALILALTLTACTSGKTDSTETTAAEHTVIQTIAPTEPPSTQTPEQTQEQTPLTAEKTPTPTTSSIVAPEPVQTPAPTPEPIKITIPVPEDFFSNRPHASEVESLKEIYADYFLMGSIVNPNDLTGRPAADERLGILRHHFNALTFENDHKPDYMWGGQSYSRPGRPTARLATMDGYMKKLIDDGFKIIGHTLVWHAQSPNWKTMAAGDRRFADGRVYKTYAETRENLELFIKTVAGHYYEHPDGIYIHTWDVVNEGIRRNPEYSMIEENWGYHTIGAIHVPQGERWNSPYYMAYANETPEGANPWDYMYDSFVFARQADPSAILYYNDYNMEDPNKVRLVVYMVNAVNLLWANDAENNAQSGEFETVGDYIGAGGRLLIEGIGLQQHDRIPERGIGRQHLQNVDDAIAAYIETGAKVSITELDVGVPGYTRSQRLSEADEIRQGIHYARLFQIFRKYAEHIERVSFWGVSDAHSWRADTLCLIFDRDHRAKLAYYAAADPDGFLAVYDR